jgi:hypothetical protein
VWECIPAIPAIGRQRQEDLKFEASLGYIAKGYLKKKKVIILSCPFPWAFRIKSKVFIQCSMTDPSQQPGPLATCS